MCHCLHCSKDFLKDNFCELLNLRKHACVYSCQIQDERDFLVSESTSVHASKTHKLSGSLLMFDSAFEKELKIHLNIMILCVQGSHKLIFIDKKRREEVSRLVSPKHVNLKKYRFILFINIRRLENTLGDTNIR